MIKKFENFNQELEVKEGWYKNGQKWYEFWYKNDKYHREDGPANQEWYENGQKKYEYWYLNDKLHRENGPTVQWWYENGQKQKEDEEWHLNGKEYTRKDWVEELKNIGSPHYKEQKILYDMEKYNL